MKAEGYSHLLGRVPPSLKNAGSLVVPDGLKPALPLAWSRSANIMDALCFSEWD